MEAKAGPGCFPGVGPCLEPRRMSIVHARLGYALVLIFGLAGLSACGNAEYVEPEIVAAGRDGVALRTKAWSDAQAAARFYCAKMGKKAQTIRRTPDQEDPSLSIYEYDCLVTDKR